MTTCKNNFLSAYNHLGILEFLVWGPIMIEEVTRNVFIKSGVINLNLPTDINEFYIDNFGNFHSGYVAPLLINLGLTAGVEYFRGWAEHNLSEGNFVKESFEYLHNHHIIIDGLSAVAYGAILAVDETIGIFGEPGLRDIPMGLVGLTIYLVARYVSNHIDPLLGARIKS